MATKWLTLAQACETLGVSRSTMGAWRRTGRGPQFRKLPNGALRISAEALEDFTESLELV